MTTLQNDISSAVTGQGKGVLFYVTPEDGKYALSFYEAQTPDERKGKQYRSESIKVRDQTIYVNDKLPLVSAVYYWNWNDQRDEWRVYYVSPDYKVFELKRSGYGDWEHGELNGQRYNLAPTSGLNANVVIWEPGKFGQLKIYVTDTDGNLMVIYSNLNEGNWSHRPRITK